MHRGKARTHAHAAAARRGPTSPEALTRRGLARAKRAAARR